MSLYDMTRLRKYQSTISFFAIFFFGVFFFLIAPGDAELCVEGQCRVDWKFYEKKGIQIKDQDPGYCLNGSCVSQFLPDGGAKPYYCLDRRTCTGWKPEITLTSNVPATGIINAGDEVTMQWVVEFATKRELSLFPGQQRGVNGNVRRYFPLQDTTITFTAEGPGGASTESLAIKVRPTIAKNRTIDALQPGMNKEVKLVRGTTTNILKYFVQGKASEVDYYTIGKPEWIKPDSSCAWKTVEGIGTKILCKNYGYYCNSGSGVSATRYSQKVTDTERYEILYLPNVSNPEKCYIIAKSPSGVEAALEFTPEQLEPPAPILNYFTANNSASEITVDFGQPVVLEWDTDNTYYPFLISKPPPDYWKGEWYVEKSARGGDFKEVDSHIVYPAHATTYTLEPGTKIERSIKVNVRDEPPRPLPPNSSKDEKIAWCVARNLGTAVGAAVTSCLVGAAIGGGIGVFAGGIGAIPGIIGGCLIGGSVGTWSSLLAGIAATIKCWEDPDHFAFLLSVGKEPPPPASFKLKQENTIPPVYLNPECPTCTVEPMPVEWNLQIQLGGAGGASPPPDAPVVTGNLLISQGLNEKVGINKTSNDLVKVSSERSAKKYGVTEEKAPSGYESDKKWLKVNGDRIIDARAARAIVRDCGRSLGCINPRLKAKIGVEITQEDLDRMRW